MRTKRKTKVAQTTRKTKPAKTGETEEARRQRIRDSQWRFPSPVVGCNFNSASNRFGKCTPYQMKVPPEWRTKHEYPPPAETFSNYDEWNRRLKSCFQDLYVRAHFMGDPAAIKLLLETAEACIAYLGKIASDRAELLRPLASKRILWPAFIGKKEVCKKMNDELMQALKLGTESMMAGRWHADSPTTQQAQTMHRWLLENSVNLGLPKISRTTQKQWFETGWEALLEVTNRRPDLHPYFRPIGKNRLGGEKAVRRANNRGMPEQTEGMKRDDVITEIKSQLRRAYFNFIRPTSKSPPVSMVNEAS